MAFEDVRAIEAFLRSGTRTGAKPAYHRALVMGQGMTILVVFPSKAFQMILASEDWTLFRPLRLMRQHVSFEILEQSAALRVWTSAPFLAFIVKSGAGRSWTSVRIARVARCN